MKYDPNVIVSTSWAGPGEVARSRHLRATGEIGMAIEDTHSDDDGVRHEICSSTVARGSAVMFVDDIMLAGECDFKRGENQGCVLSL